MPNEPPDPRKRPYLLSLRASKPFILTTIALGLFTDLFLYGLIVPILPFLLSSRLSTPPSLIQSRTSILLAAYAATQLLTSLPAGYIADRFFGSSRRRVPFLLGLLALIGATVLFAVGRSWGLLLLARVMQGVSASVVWTVGLAMVLDTVGAGELGRVMGAIFSVISVGDLVAPVLGGVLYEKVGYMGVFWLGMGLLVVDLGMRLVVVERGMAREWDSGESGGEGEGGNDDGEDADEEDPLLPSEEVDEFTIPEGQGKIITAMPILYCLGNPRLLTALLLAFVQALLLASFDATIPLEAQKLFGFDSLQSGLLFIPPGVTYILLGPPAGWAVDRYGTKAVATAGFGYLVPALALLRLPSDGIVHDKDRNIALLCGLLFLMGVGLAVIGSPSIVEASFVVQKYEKANPGFFGEGGGYAQLYAFNSLFFSGGLTVGPILSGLLRDRLGYGAMNAVLAGIALVTSILSFVFVGGRPKMLRAKTT